MWVRQGESSREKSASRHNSKTIIYIFIIQSFTKSSCFDATDVLHEGLCLQFSGFEKIYSNIETVRYAMAHVTLLPVLSHIVDTEQCVEVRICPVDHLINPVKCQPLCRVDLLRDDIERHQPVHEHFSDTRLVLVGSVPASVRVE